MLEEYFEPVESKVYNFADLNLRNDCLGNSVSVYTERGKLIIRQTPFKRFGNPDELKGALVWLLGDESQFVTGSMICVDGGFSIFGGV